MKPRFSPLLACLVCTLAATPAFAGNTDDAGTRTYTGNDNTSITLTGLPADNTKVIFDMTSSGSSNYFGDTQQYDGNVQIGGGTADATQGLCINNGNRDKVVTFTGTVTGNGLLSKTGRGTDLTIAFTGDVTGYTGAINLGSDAHFSLRFGGGNAAPATATATQGVSGTGTITFSKTNDELVYNYSAGATPVYVTNAIAKSGSGTSRVTIAGAAAMEFNQSVVIDTLTISNSAAHLTFHSGSLGRVSGSAAGLAKTGSGALAIGDLGGNTMTLNEGALTGTLTNGTIAAGTGGSLGTTDAGFTLNGGTIDFGNATTAATLSATGTLTLTSGALTIGNLESLTTTETYVLLNGSDLTWGSTDFSGLTLNGNLLDTNGYFLQTIDGVKYKGHLSVADSSNNLILSIETVNSQILTWNGGNGIWQQGAAGWNSDDAGDGSATFSTDDEVIFGGNSTPETISLSGEISPLNITVSKGDYTFAGDGHIAGVSGLTLGNGSDAATLTLNTANANWSGTVNLQANGTLVLGNADALGKSAIVFNGGVLQYGTGIATDISGQITGTGAIKVVTSDANVTWGTDVLSSHAVEKSGAGSLSLALTAGATYTNALTANEGELSLNVASGTATYNGTMSGSGIFVKTGAGTLQTDAASTLTGTHIRIDAGTWQLGIERDTTFSSAPASVSVTGGATLALFGGVISMDTVLNLANNASLKLSDGSPSTSPSNPNFTFTGDVTLGNADVNATDKTVVNIKSPYDKTLKLQGKVTGNGQLLMTADRDNEWGAKAFIYLTNEDNDFSGGIQINRQGGYVQVSNAGALGTGILNLNHVDSGFKYAGTSANGSYDTLKGGSAQNITGTGGVEILSGNLELQGNNTYTGATTIADGSLKVSGSIGSASSANTYSVNGNGSLVLAGTGTVANSAVSVGVNTGTAKAATEATLTGVSVTTTAIARTAGSGKGRIANGNIDVTAASFAVSDVELANSMLNIQSAGTVTLTNVTLGAGTRLSSTGGGHLTLANSALILSSDNLATAPAVGSGENAGTVVLSYTMTNATLQNTSFTLDFTAELLREIGALAGGPYTDVRLTLTGVETWEDVQLTLGNEATLLGASITNTPGALNGGVVIDVHFSSPIPEPASATLGLFGLASLLLRRRRRA